MLCRNKHIHSGRLQNTHAQWPPTLHLYFFKDLNLYWSITHVTLIFSALGKFSRNTLTDTPRCAPLLCQVPLCVVKRTVTINSQQPLYVIIYFSRPHDSHIIKTLFSFTEVRKLSWTRSVAFFKICLFYYKSYPLKHYKENIRIQETPIVEA